MLREDCNIPGKTNEDGNDKAKHATVTADSEISYEITGDLTWLPLDRVRGCELWDFENRIDRMSFLLNNRTDQSKELNLKLYRFAPERPWQRHGERAFFDYYNIFQLLMGVPVKA